MTATFSRPSVWLLLLGLIVLAALTLPAVLPKLYPTHPDHAESEAIRACAKDPANLMQIWVNASGERLNCLVKLPGDMVGDLVVQTCNRLAWVEITSYILGDGTLTEAVRVLRAKMCQRVY
jgi:hypothetical protein